MSEKYGGFLFLQFLQTYTLQKTILNYYIQYMALTEIDSAYLDLCTILVAGRVASLQSKCTGGSLCVQIDIPNLYPELLHPEFEYFMIF